MRRYYVLTSAACVSDAVTQPVWPIEIEPRSTPYWDLTVGKPVANWQEDEWATCESFEHATDYPFASHLLPVVSTRMRTTIESLGIQSIQYLPIRIVDRMQVVCLGYSIANVLQVVDATDEDKSEIERWTKFNLPFWSKRSWMLGTFRSIRRVVLDESKVGDHRLFVLKGSDWIIVRDDVKQGLEAASITGIGFRDPEVDPILGSQN